MESWIDGWVCTALSHLVAHLKGASFQSYLLAGGTEEMLLLSAADFLVFPYNLYNL